MLARSGAGARRMADDTREAGEAAQPPGEAAAAEPGNWSPIPDAGRGDRSWVLAAWRWACREPALLFTTAYVLVAFLGLWSSYWFYRGFGIAILDYLQASDYLVAGLRDPAYLLIFASGVLLAVLVSWPDTLRRRYPARIDALRRQRWWWRALFPRARLMSWDGVGIHPVTGISVVVASFMLFGAAGYMLTKAERLREHGSGAPMQVHLTGDAQPLPQLARLLGTSNSFVYLWWPQQRRAEAVPIAAVRRLQAMPLPLRSAKPAAPLAAPSRDGG